MNVINWGTPLETIACILAYATYLNDKNAHLIARELYRKFMRVNPNYWN